MGDRHFKLATISSAGSPPFVAIALDDRLVSLPAVVPHLTASQPTPERPLPLASMLALLETWDASFEVLQEVVAFIDRHGLEDERWKHGVSRTSEVRFHAPIPRPPKMLYAQVNYPNPKQAPPPKDDIVRRPAMFQKPSSCVVGPYDDIIKPRGFDDLSWEVEFALAIGRIGKRIPAERALDHVAGYLTVNDVTVNNFRVPGETPFPGPDWYGSKGHDTFAPLGPYLVPRAFIADHRNLRLTCKVNGETLQDGNTRDLIFSPEEQIAHCSNQSRLEPGDIVSTGTPYGIALHLGRFLKVGDLVECEVEGLGAQRSRLIDPAP